MVRPSCAYGESRSEWQEREARAWLPRRNAPHLELKFFVRTSALDARKKKVRRVPHSPRPFHSELSAPRPLSPPYRQTYKTLPSSSRTASPSSKPLKNGATTQLDPRSSLRRLETASTVRSRANAVERAGQGPRRFPRDRVHRVSHRVPPSTCSRHTPSCGGDFTR